MHRAIVLALTLCNSALAAQQHPLVGAWQLTYPAGVQIENGVRTVIMGDAELTIAAQGDSLIATLVYQGRPDLPARPPSRMAAVAGAGPIVFVQRSMATLNTDGNEREAVALSTWTLSANGDAIEGTVARRIEGFPEGDQSPEPVKGTRRKG